MSGTLRTRVLTAVVLAATLLVILLGLPSWATVVVLTALLLAGAWEWSAFLRLPQRAWRFGYVLLIVALLWVAWQLSASVAGRDWVLGLAVGWWLVALGWIVFAPRRVSAWSAGLAGVLALVPSWVSLVRLRLVFPHGAQWVL
ncbi:MAG TPA: phosphatidate cytidylyltransferase, partial [Steroidobacteraceae bacterium]|nr:phosphatidate cytidylyltransferase [Steroidobacteraceae bacterium]